MSSPKAKSGGWSWRFIGGTLVAGLLTFIMAGFVNLVLREASASAQPPLVTSIRAPATSHAALTLPSDGSSQEARGIASEAAVAPTRAERLDAAVKYNPFAALGIAPPLPVIVPATAQAKPAVKQVQPPAPPPPPPLPPPPPTAPPLPFVAVGSIQGAQVTNGQPVAFIRQQEHLMVVRAGDAIGQNYKVESISAQAIEFTYIPLMQRQSLALAP